MLVLDRKLNEGFWIEDRIFIKVLSIGKRRIKLGIEAPDDVTIVREELAEGAKRSPNGRPDPASEQDEETYRSASMK